MNKHNKSYEAVFFDLDGTITEPAEGVINAILYAVEQSGKHEPQPEELVSFIGPPLHHSFQQRYHTTEAEAMAMVEQYRVYYGKKGIFECKLYDGIAELMRSLYNNGIYISLATSKPIFYAQQLLDYYQLSPYVSFVGGANLDGSRTDKKEVIQYVLNHVPPFAKDKILMLGDREFDIAGGHHFGLDTAWAQWGYGTAAIIDPLQPTYRFQKPLELLTVCL